MMSKISLIRQVSLRRAQWAALHLSKLIGDCSLPTHSCCIFKWVSGNITSPSVNF